MAQHADSGTLPIRAAARAARVEPGLRDQFFAAARGIPDLIGLGRGDPDFATPPHIVEAARRALDQGFTHYTHWRGMPELRAAIARKLDRENGLSVDPDTEVVVTSGAQEAVYIAMQLLLDPGDQVLIADPHYSGYDAAIELAGGAVVPVPTYERDNFELRPELLEASISPRARLLLLVTPNNPSGDVVSRERCEAIARIAERHNLVVVADELYENFIYDGSHHISFASLPGMRARTITINGFSKTYAMTGFRLGYVAGPAEFMRLIGELKYAISICAPAAAQMAGLAALEGPQDVVREMSREYDERRRFLLSALDGMGLTYGTPRGRSPSCSTSRAPACPQSIFVCMCCATHTCRCFPGQCTDRTARVMRG